LRDPSEKLDTDKYRMTNYMVVHKSSLIHVVVVSINVDRFP